MGGEQKRRDGEKQTNSVIHWQPSDGGRSLSSLLYLRNEVSSYRRNGLELDSSVTNTEGVSALFRPDCSQGGFASKSIFLCPRSGLNDNSPALKRWGKPIDPFGVREADD